MGRVSDVSWYDTPLFKYINKLVYPVAYRLGPKEMSMNIYVGNLSFNVKDSDLREAFEAFGTVESAKVIEDRDTGRSRGFGFVEMPEKSEGESAIAGMNGKNLMDRDLKVNEAKPKTEGGRGGGGFGGGGGGRRY